ncbi:MAG: tRNA pseudouridine(55) synthase TruB [Clostridia bacterium]|nr:tRNA pseudouridine(55) synthase TruB [Clostridia bacterium]
MTGFICINKPQGITSFITANRVRRIASVKKTGHTGTLDPMATGVLPVMLGGATKFADFIPSSGKAYIADILLGVETDTYDVTGTVLQEKEVNVTSEEFKHAVEAFTGEIQQVPPMYSAISQNGVRLYQLARKGVEVEREKRNVTIYSAEILEKKADNLYSVLFSCSAGTYIRSLAFDIGRFLGCGACLKSLQRTYSNGFSIEDAITLEEAAALAEEGKLEEKIIPVEKVMEVYPEVTVSEAQAKRFKNGGALALNRIKGFSGSGLFRVYSPEKEFLGLGKTNEETKELDIARLYIEV